MKEPKILIGRAINGISINGLEYVLDDLGKPREFENINQAKMFLKANGFEFLSDEELEDAFTFTETNTETMTKEEYAKEVGMVAAIISDAIMEELYSEKQRQGAGYMDTVEQISTWAQEFVNNHENTNWENLLNDGNFGKSSKMRRQELLCWDDVVFDFAYLKLEEFKVS
jgi:hypothetical protein